MAGEAGVIEDALDDGNDFEVLFRLRRSLDAVEWTVAIDDVFHYERSREEELTVAKMR